MKFDIDKWSEITSAITKNKSRSILTAFGIFWGIFMWVLLMGGGEGLERMMAENFNGFATNSCCFMSSKTSKPYNGFGKGRYWSLHTTDVALLKKSMKEADIITPIVSRWGQEAKRGTRKINVETRGCYKELEKIEPLKIESGRFLNEMDVNERRRVCIINKKIVNELFPDGTKPVGQTICVNGVFLRVIGVNNSSNDYETTVIIPYTVMQQLYNLGNTVDQIHMTVKKRYGIEEVAPRAEEIIKGANSIAPDDDEAIVFINFEAMFRMVSNLFDGIRLLVWLIGIGTLLSGAIGVSNIMMVTVKERTSEIGIRRAIGARPRDILTQIIMESVVLTVAAGMLGILFAVLALQGIESVVRESSGTVVSFQISFWLAIGAASILTLLGIVAGIAPAIRALAVKPVDAMREE